MNRFLVYLCILLTVLSLITGTLYWRSRSRYLTDPNIALRDAHPLLGRRLFWENPKDLLINFDPLRRDVREYLDSLNTPYSFYFEYLPTGTSIRSGENNPLVGASLMKIPIVMNLYKAAEQSKISLDDEVVVPSDIVQGNDPEYGSPSGLKPGEKIKLRQAAKIALSESDNTAAYTIFQATEKLLDERDQALNNLDIETRVGDSDQGKFVLIGSRQYTSFLKCLYFACFLNFDNSQEILGYLTERGDDMRIRAGVPNDVKTATKIGSFSDITQSDCGIVYAGSRPYTICVMIDENAANADRQISTVSKKVYDYVTTVNN